MKLRLRRRKDCLKKKYQIKSHNMISDLKKILTITSFFNTTQLTDSIARYKFKTPCKILLQNIHSSWLQSLHTKTQKHFPVYLSESFIQKKKTPFGYINNTNPLQFIEEFNHNLSDFAPNKKSELKFNIVVPGKDIMPYFIQWQRYRKYWWSSITTTPSLFGIDDIKYQDDAADVNIVAKFPWGQQTVETVHIRTTTDKKEQSTSCLTCKTTLEEALFILLLDGITNSTKEGYLRLHRKMAPFKISFALNFTDADRKKTLKDLATLLHHNLEKNNISSLLPDFSHSIDTQLKENLKIGIAYTAIISEDTLCNGIFHLLNSSTMLQEQIHVADFNNYALLISR